MDIQDLSQIKQGKLRLNKQNFEIKKAINDIKELFLRQCEFKGLYLHIEYNENEIQEKVYSDEKRMK